MHPYPNAHPARDHPIATGLAWLFGAIATLLTGLLIWIGVAVAVEWSGYVGHETSTALAILGFISALTLIAWGLTWITLTSRKSQQNTSKRGE